MKPTTTFKVQKADLYTAMKHTSKTHMSCSKCISHGYSMTFSCFVFQLEGSVMHVSTSNYHMVTTDSINVGKEGADRAFAISAQALSPVIRRLDDQELTVELWETQVAFNHSLGRFTLPLVIDETEIFFYRVNAVMERPTDYSLEVEVPIFRSILTRLCRYTAQDNLRPVLNGICIRRKAGMVGFMASNGQILMCIEREDQECSFPSSVIIPNQALAVLRSIMPRSGFIQIEYSEWKEDDKDAEDPVCRVSINGVQLCFMPVQGRFPDVTKVIPPSSVHSCSISKKLISDSLERMKFFSPVRETARATIGKGLMTLYAQDKDFEIEASESLPCECSNQPFGFGLGIKNVQIVLGSIHCKKVIILAGEVGRALVVLPEVQPENESIVTIFMPCIGPEDEETEQ